MLVARGPASADIVMVLAMTKTRRVGNAQLATILEGVRCAEGKEKPNRSTTWLKCSPISIPLCFATCSALFSTRLDFCHVLTPEPLLVLVHSSIPFVFCCPVQFFCHLLSILLFHDRLPCYTT